jgi:hypothetical protein
MKRASLVCQSQALRPALDEPDPEALFEFRDPPRQRGFRASGNPGSAAKPTIGSNKVKV